MNVHIKPDQLRDSEEYEMVFTIQEFRTIMLDWGSQKSLNWDLLERGMKLMWCIPGRFNPTLLEDFLSKESPEFVRPKEAVLNLIQVQFSRTLGNEVLPDFQCLLAGSKKCSHLMTKEGASSQGDVLKSEFCNRIWITE